MDIESSTNPTGPATASSIPQFTILNPMNAVKYMKMAQDEPRFLKLIRETFEITHTFTKGLTLNELDIIISRTSQIPKQNLLQQVRLLKDGEAKLLASTKQEQKLRHTWVVRAEFNNGKFNVLSVSATQTKQLNATKVATCGFGALTLCTLGFIVNPLLGIGITASTAVGAAAIARNEYKDYCECPPDVIYGPIFEYLRDNNILDVAQS